jgi:hypothetical protein
MAAMRDALPGALIHGYQPLTDSMLNDEKDRHCAPSRARQEVPCLIVSVHDEDRGR